MLMAMVDKYTWKLKVRDRSLKHILSEKVPEQSFEI